MMKGKTRLSASRPLAAFLTTSTNHLARYAITLTPEQLSLYEGARAGLVTALALTPSLFFDQPVLAWIAFACFWACLIDPGGPNRERFQVLGGFTLAGTLLVFGVSSLSLFGPWATVPLVALIGLGCGLARMFSPAVMQLWALAGCAAVAATGFPSPPRQAAEIAGLFFAGGALATLFCLVLWRQQPYAPARRSLSATFYILDLMARELSAGRLREAVHRQAARNAIERARTLLLMLDARHGNMRLRRRMEATLMAAERVFTALLALEHLSQNGPLSPELRVLLGRLGMACHECMRQVARPEPDFRILGQLAQRLDRESRNGGVVNAMPVIACAAAFQQMIAAFSRRHREESEGQSGRGRALTPLIWRHSLRLSLALTLTQIVCLYGGEGFSYWALIAALLVMQPAGNLTIVRSMERVVGSIGGSLLAALCALVLPGKIPLLIAAVFLSLAAIATRAVNYTMLVFFLTGLVVVIAEALMPGGGIVWARVLDNLIGSGIALLCVLLLWPQRGDSDRETLVRRAILAHCRYASLVLSGDTDQGQTDKAQREAGMTTIAAEFSRGGLPLFGGLVTQLRDGESRDVQAVLRALRRLSGELTLYRFDMQNGLRSPDLQEAERFERWAQAIASEGKSRGAKIAPQDAERTGPLAMQEVLTWLNDETALMRLGQKAGLQSRLEGDAAL
ncbi:FUSC family protein [Asaia bogorensis]|uniref:FUSC family protein n=1 Tax=Asaia bogorensis TaxID=91915 RepID=UPI0013CE52F3|nr:FUSC family protein [Asaia bogorensis]